MKRFCAALFLFMTFLGGVGWWYFLASVPLKELPGNRFLPEGARLENGVINWFEVLKSQYPEGWQTDRNAFRRITKTIFVYETATNWPALSEEKRKILLEEQEEMMGLLALEPEEYRDLRFLPDPVCVYHEMVNEKYADDDEEREKRDVENSADIFALDPEFAAEWVRENSPVLDEIARILLDSEMYFIPLIGDGRHCAAEQLLPYHESARLLARGLTFRAAYRIRQGELDGAIADAEACRRLGHLFQENAAFMVDLLTGLNIKRMVLALPFYENIDAPLSEDQLAKLEEIARKYPLDMREEVYLRIEQSDKMMYLDMILPSPYSKEYEYDEFMFHPLFYLGVDWNIAVTEMARIQSRRQTDPELDLASEQEEWFQKQCEEFPLRFLFKKESYGSFSYLEDNDWFLCLLPRKTRSVWLGMGIDAISAPGYAQAAFQRASDHAALERLFFALERYRLAHEGECLPRSVQDGDGKPLHSWRVMLLPYLGEAEKELFAKIRLDEPWNSPYNAQFHTVRVEAFERKLFPSYGSQKLEWKAGETFFAAGKDPDSALPVDLLILEEPVCWMAPNPDQKPESESDYGSDQKSAP